MQYLGTTIEQIAAEKAGIIKKGVPVVFFDKRAESTEVIKKRALELDSRAIAVEPKSIENVDIIRDEGDVFKGGNDELRFFFFIIGFLL